MIKVIALDVKMTYGSTHNPLYDCEVAFKTYLHIQQNYQANKEEQK